MCRKENEMPNPTAYRVVANSLPRGGPFLLASALDLLGYRKFAGNGDTPRALNYQEAKKALAKVSSLAHPHVDLSDSIGVSLFAPLAASPTTVRQWLTAVTVGEYMMGHMPWSAPLATLMVALDYRQVVILRDPRTLLLALLFLDEMMPRFLTDDFAQLTPLQQVEKLWVGGYLPRADVNLQPFATVYRSMLAWRGTPNTLLLRFEELVGPQAGGTDRQQQQALAELATFLALPLDETLRSRVDQIVDPSAYTFVQAQRSNWLEAVDRAVIDYVEHHCAPLCQEAEYRL